MEPLLCGNESKKLTRSCIDAWGCGISQLQNGFEKECVQLVNLLDQVRLNWKKAEAEKNVYRDRCRILEEKNEELRTENDAVHDRLVNCQAEMESIIVKKEGLELQLSDYKRRFDDVRGIFRDPAHEIQHLAFACQQRVLEKRCSEASSSLDSSTAYSEDGLALCHVTPPGRGFTSIHHDLDLELARTTNSDRASESADESPHTPRMHQPKRRSRSHDPAASARRFAGQGPEATATQTFVATATIKVDPTGVQEPSGTLSIFRSSKKSTSESSLSVAGRGCGDTTIQDAPTTPSTSSYSRKSIASSWNNGQLITRRIHRVEKFQKYFGSCYVCNKSFGFAGSEALNCVDCKVRFHRSCHRFLAMPCVPYVEIPKCGKNQKLSLKTYCPQSHPMIPRILIQCVVALEADRLAVSGIYRVPEDEAAVAKLQNKMLTGRVSPNLASVNTETITAVIKHFLGGLKDSLIPTASFEEFKAAVDSNSDENLEKAVFDLPNANRDTLAYLLIHLHKVAAFSEQNKMSLKKLVSEFAALVVGYSSFVTTTSASQETVVRTQKAVLWRLAQMPQEFWVQFMERDMSAIIYSEKTPNIQKDSLNPQAAKLRTRKTDTPRRPGDRASWIQPGRVAGRL